ncbi:MAG: thiol:disulfide interchange protein DsbA/DsbL [Legionella sp.]|jgi:thiol:disulfide interchange protein DsbA
MFRKLLWILVLIPSLALAAEFIEGKDYQVLTNTKPVENKTTGPVVTEFFSYGCPWCFKMETPLNGWLATVGKNIQLERVPVVFRPEWELYAKAYYTSKMLAMTNKMNPLLFKAIQEDKKPLNTKQAMIDFFVAQGIDKEIAKSAFENSPSIDMRVTNGTALMASYQISAVPAFVVNNKYKTDLQMTGSPERLFAVMDYLIKKG